MSRCITSFLEFPTPPASIKHSLHSFIPSLPAHSLPAFVPSCLLFSHSVHPNLCTLFSFTVSLLSSPLMLMAHWCGLCGDALSIPLERNGPMGLQDYRRHWATSVCVSEWKHVVCVCPASWLYQVFLFKAAGELLNVTPIDFISHFPWNFPAISTSLIGNFCCCLKYHNFWGQHYKKSHCCW